MPSTTPNARSSAVESRAGSVVTDQPPLREFRQRLASPQLGRQRSKANVGPTERLLSAAAGSVLGAVGLSRGGLPGLAIAGIGGALLYRGASGQCAGYRLLGINTAESVADPGRDSGVHVAVSYLIDKPASELYQAWRDFERLPEFMEHLESVERVDDRRSHWVAKAPSVYGGTVEWDAEVIADEPDARIEWRSLEGSDIDHRGSIRFSKAPGNRGTLVRVQLRYAPPAGQIGRWTAKLFGEEPEQQVRQDLRNFKRLMETGEIPTTDGQPHGSCVGIRRSFRLG
jgi:uncharacterized membrane protein